MADTKLTGLTTISTASSVDLVYIAHDPFVTPVSRAISASSLFKSVPSTGLVIGGDTNLYRESSGNLKTDGSFTANNNLGSVAGNLYLYSASSKIYFGDGAGGYDTNLYRSAANTLKTDDTFISGSWIGTSGVAPGAPLQGYEVSSGTGSKDLVGQVVSTYVGGESGPLFGLRVGSVIGGAIAGVTETGGWQGALIFYSHGTSSNNNVGSGLLEGLRIDSAQKLWIGGSTDTNLYRSAANILKTDDAFICDGGLVATGNMYNRSDSNNTIFFGASDDTNLYRSAASSLKTDDNFVIAGSALTLSNSVNPTIFFGSSNDTYLYRGAAASLALHSNLTLDGDLYLDGSGVFGNSALAASNGDVLYTSNLRPYRSSTTYTGFVFVPKSTPLTSSRWGGSGSLIVGTSSIDLSAHFGSELVGATAILLQFQGSWGGTADGTANYITFRPRGGGTNQARISNLTSAPQAATLFLATDTTNFDIDTVVTGSQVNTITMRIWGYFI